MPSETSASISSCVTHIVFVATIRTLYILLILLLLCDFGEESLQYALLCKACCKCFRTRVYIATSEICLIVFLFHLAFLHKAVAAEQSWNKVFHVFQTSFYDSFSNMSRHIRIFFLCVFLRILAGEGGYLFIVLSHCNLCLFHFCSEVSYIIALFFSRSMYSCAALQWTTASSPIMRWKIGPKRSCCRLWAYSTPSSSTTSPRCVWSSFLGSLIGYMKTT